MSENQTGVDRPIITTVEAPEPCRRVIRAEVARSLYEREYADRLKKAARTHHRPGFRKGHTPKAVLERPKQGFEFPIGGWIRQELRAEIDALLTDRAASASIGLDGDAREPRLNPGGFHRSLHSEDRKLS